VVPAQDAKGHSARLWVRVPPGVERQMEILIAAKKLPYKTVSDMIRHAISRHLEFLHVHKGGAPRHLMTSIRATDELVREDDLRAAAEESFRALNRRIEDHLDKGDNQEAVRLLAFVQQEIRAVAECGWKKRFMARFTRNYGRYLQTGGAISTELTPQSGTVEGEEPEE
jgi:Arc/MetJ-type ribon-helix-helix transcriptional regulator